MMKDRSRPWRWKSLAACAIGITLTVNAAEVSVPSAVPSPNDSGATSTPVGTANDLDAEQLRKMFLEQQLQLAEQQRQLDELRRELADQKVAPAATVAAPAATPVQIVPAAFSPAPAPAAAQAPAVASDTNAKLDTMQKSIDALNRGINGFRFTGDLRFRTDVLVRKANKSLPPTDNRATPQQRARERYRFRFNIDKDLMEKEGAPAKASIHVQLATDPFNNPSTMDTDFAGISTRAPISIAEAYVDFRPMKGVTLRAGRTTELYADNRQFVYDDDIRFNGFHETYRWTGKKNGLFVQVAAAQYILTDPNIQVLPAGSPFLAAGYSVGQRVPSSNLLDQGITVGSNIGKKWSHNETFNYFVVREPNQIQLASTNGGAALFANSPVVGATLTSNLGETGNATTTAGGATYFASEFHVSKGGLNLNYSGKAWKGHNFPVSFFIQGTHNSGASFDQNGFMVGGNIGSVAKLGDVQFQYQYYYKPANAFISQFSDDDVGTGAGTNVKNNQIRVNFGINRFLVWENRLYIQKGISVNNPSINYFLPLQAGYNTQFRLHSQLVFTF
ncbi:MAG: putative porin [Acidobacteriota bacterium]